MNYFGNKMQAQILFDTIVLVVAFAIMGAKEVKSQDPCPKDTRKLSVFVYL